MSTKTVARDPEPPKQHGRGFSLSNTEFVCPECGSKKWGSARMFGQPEKGFCRGIACPFSWVRTFDWTVFREVATGKGFLSFEAFEVACRR
jgi:hypothetical protein